VGPGTLEVAVARRAERIWHVHRWTRLLPDGSLRARVAGGYIWSTLAAVMSQLSQLLGLVIAARLMGRFDFGELGIVNTTVVLFGAYANLGLSFSVIKYVGQHRIRDPRMAGEIAGFLSTISVVSGTAVAAGMVLAAPFLASHVFAAPQLVTPLRISSAIPLLNVLNGVQVGTLMGVEDFRAVCVSRAIGSVIGLAMIASGAALFGLDGAVAGYVGGAVALLVVSQLYVRASCQEHGIRVTYSVPHWSVLWKFALPSVLVAGSQQPFIWLARVLLVHQHGGYLQLGLFTAAFAWSNVLVFIPAQLSLGALSILANLYGHGAAQSASRVVSANLVVSAGSSIVIALPLMALSPLLLGLYGPGYASSWPVLVVILLAFVFGSAAWAYRDALATSGRMWTQALHSAIWGAALLVTSLLLIRQAALGLALAYLASYSLLFALQTTVLARRRALLPPSATVRELWEAIGALAGTVRRGHVGAIESHGGADLDQGADLDLTNVVDFPYPEDVGDSPSKPFTGTVR
jgi:O-antigen/teichoic acid export membrane protein